MPKFTFSVFGGFSIDYEEDQEVEEEEREEEREERCYYDYVLMKKVCPRKERLRNTTTV